MYEKTIDSRTADASGLRKPTIEYRHNDFSQRRFRDTSGVGQRGRGWGNGQTVNAALVISFLALSACGLDGQPAPKSDTRPSTGISVSGDARIGVTGSL